MDQFILKGSKKTSTVGGGQIMINTSSKPQVDEEMKDETKPKFIPWVEK
jgi:hypothetical protein